MLNQDVHKNLRRNKNGIRLEDVAENMSAFNYKRPAGFSLVPNMLSLTHSSSASSNFCSNPKSASYFDRVQDEMQR